MKKIITLNFFILFLFQSAFSQTKKIDDLYFDYTQFRNSPNRKEAKSKALALLERSAELNEKQIANINFHLGSIYEEDKQPELAIPHYQNVIKTVPGHYVTQRALAFIYLRQGDALGKKVTAAAQLKNATLHAEAFKNYKKQVLLTLPYFEKSQACDPDENTLNIINNLYKTIKEPQQLSTLNSRLKTLANDCVSLLDE